MNVHRSESGQLLPPILAVMFLFGLFLAIYIQWCRHVYWQMRMDMAADATALSAGREEAAMLNTIGTYQIAENLLLQKAKLGKKDVAEVQLPLETAWVIANEGLRMTADAYSLQVLEVAKKVANANGADDFPRPDPFPQHHLIPQGVDIYLFAGIAPEGETYFPCAYFARDWAPRTRAPQPPHQTIWEVQHGHIKGQGKVRLWLDVNPNAALNNGGFPSPQASGLKGLGIQCNYPQFNARLMPKFLGPHVE